MKKVVLLAEFGQVGGTRVFFRQLVRFYSMHKFDVVALLPRAQLDVEVRTLLEQHRCRWQIVPGEQRRHPSGSLRKRFPFNALWDVSRMYQFIRNEKPDLLVTCVGTPGLFLGLIILPYRFLYILLTYPHGTPDDVSRVHGAKVGKWIKSSLLRVFLGRKKMILTVSNFSKERIVKAWLNDVSASSVSVVHNTAGESSLECATKRSPGEKKVRVLTIGHVTWYKNPFTWIAVAQKVVTESVSEDVEFIWVGEGDQLQECRSIVFSAGLQDRVKFVGFQENVKDFYLSSQIYFQPSIVESHAISVLEAMRYGLPCVVSDAGGLPESVVDSETGFVVNVDAKDAMAAAMLQLVVDPRLRERFGLAARKTYQEHFDEDIWHRKMLLIHERILDSSADFGKRLDA